MDMTTQFINDLLKEELISKEQHAKICEKYAGAFPVMLSKGEYDLEIFNEHGEYAFAMLAKLQGEDDCSDVFNFKVKQKASKTPNNLRFNIVVTKDSAGC